MNRNPYDRNLLAPTPQPGTEAEQQAHGDMRKAAYLQRRAAYQQQAQAGTSAQPGGTPTRQHKA